MHLLSGNVAMTQRDVGTYGSQLVGKQCLTVGLSVYVC
jgi:hypothetical protein